MIASTTISARGAVGTLSRAVLTPRARLAVSSNFTPLVKASPALSMSCNRGLARTFTTGTLARRNETPSSVQSPTQSEPQILAKYQGPMGKTLYRLKLFSLGSLAMATLFGPVFFAAPAADITLLARTAMYATGLLTSGGGTLLVNFVSKPYVGRMALVKYEGAAKPVLELYTLSWRIRPLKTTIYRPEFIRPTSRPFASWELTDNPASGQDRIVVPEFEGADGQVKQVLVSQTVDAVNGKVVGSWWVRNVPGTATKVDGAEEDGDFTEDIECFAEGKPVRHFQVHEELLGDDFRIL